MVRLSGERIGLGELSTRPSPSAPTLFVGIGGAGCRMVARVAKHLGERADDQELYRHSIRFALVDANVNDLESCRELADETFLISDFEKDAYADLASGKLFLEADPYFTQWVPPGYRSRTSLMAGAGQIRFESRLGVYYQMKHKDFVPRFRRLLEGLAPGPQPHHELGRARREIRIILCYSLAGGTGSGSHLPIAYLLRDLASRLGRPLLLGVALLPAVFEELTGINRDRTFANGYAALKELEHLMRLGAADSLFHPEEGLAFHYDPSDESKRTVHEQPFDLVYIVDRPESFRGTELIDAAADGLYLQLFSPLFGVQAADYENYAAHRRFLVPREFEKRGLLGFSTSYGSYGAAVLRVPVLGLVEYCAQAAALSLLRESFLTGFAGRQIFLEQAFEGFERDRMTHLDRLRQEGERFSDQYVLEAEALQIENGRRMWDFYYEDKVAHLPELGPGDPRAQQALSRALTGLSASKENTTSAVLLDRLHNALTDFAREILRTRIGGDPRSSHRESRDGLTLAEALEHEVVYRSLYYANRALIDSEGARSIRELLRLYRNLPSEKAVRLNDPVHRDYLRDKVRQLIRYRLKLLSDFDEERTLAGGLRPAHILLAVVDEGLRNAAVISEILSADPGITWVTSGWHNPREVLFYRSVLNVPLYVFGRMKEMKAEYARFQRLSHRPAMLHIDRNWERSLPDLDPESAIARPLREIAPPPPPEGAVRQEEPSPAHPSDWKYDVFLSFSSSHEAMAERLAQKLVEAGLRPFFSKWHLIPGEPWQEALEEALDSSRVYAVLIGAGGFGPWQNEEVRSALDERARDHSLRVIPVLLPGAGLSREEGSPRFLRRLTRVSFDAGLEDERAFERLLSGIRGEAPGAGNTKGGSSAAPYRSMASPPEGFILRREYEQVVQALLAGRWREGQQGLESLVGLQTGARAVGITTALRGAGGYGKTALAQAVCQEERVRQAYPDGILWTTLGDKLDAAGRLARVRDLIRWWSDEEPPAFETLDAGSAHLRGLLAARRVLLVLDDVWRPDDLAPFHGLGAGTVLLVTTRDGSTLPDSATTVLVDAMATREAVALLGAELPEVGDEELRHLAARLGEWPLLLKIVNRQLRELVKEGLTVDEALREVREALEAEGLTAFDSTSSESRNRAVAGTLDASLSALSRQERDLFGRLAIFPEDQDVPLSILTRLWDLDLHRVKRLCGRLYNLSLLLRFDRLSGMVRLHDVVHSYLHQKQKERLPEIHRQLLDACLPVSGRWTDLPPKEGYLWQHQAHHLIGSGRSGELRELLLDFEHVRARLHATDVNALLADYAALASRDPELSAIQEALSLSASTLAKDGRELAGQLLGRLADRREAGIQRLLQGARGWREGAWLRPRIRSLRQSEGESPRLREGHTNGINALAVLGRALVSASSDRTLRLWNLENAEAIGTFEGHEAGVNAVAILGENRVVSGSDDGTLRIWDLSSGEAARILSGHTGGVRALAVVDEHRIISGSEDGTLRVWDARTGETLHISRGHTAGIRAVAAIDGRSAVSGSIDGTLRVWDLESGKPLLTHGFAAAISVMARLDNRRIAMGSDDGTLWVWDLVTGAPLRSFAGHRAWIFALAVLSDGSVVSSAGDRTVRVWHLEAAQRVSTFTFDAPATAVAGAPGGMLVVGDTSGCLHFLDVVEGA